MACLLASTFLMFLREQWLWVGAARLLATILAGGIIKVGAKHQSHMLTNRLVMWIGDHSYTVRVFKRS